jgi:hypothetical protein
LILPSPYDTIEYDHHPLKVVSMEDEYANDMSITGGGQHSRAALLDAEFKQRLMDGWKQVHEGNKA